MKIYPELFINFAGRQTNRQIYSFFDGDLINSRRCT